MKKFISVFAVITVILSAFCVFSGCNNNPDSSQAQTTTAPQTTTQAETTATQKTQIDNAVVGTWQLSQEDGQKDNLFYYVFDAEGKATLAIDNVAYVGEYTISENTDAKPTLTTQLYYNLNGTYAYEVSEDKQKITLVGEGDENTDTFIMSKVDDYNFMPQAPKEPVIDEKIVGSWVSDGGMKYTFNENGTMISNSFDMLIIYAQYEAKDGKINAKYSQGTEVENTYEYSVDGDVLTIDGVEFKKTTDN